MTRMWQDPASSCMCKAFCCADGRVLRMALIQDCVWCLFAAVSHKPDRVLAQRDYNVKKIKRARSEGEDGFPPRAEGAVEEVGRINWVLKVQNREDLRTVLKEEDREVSGWWVEIAPGVGRDATVGKEERRVGWGSNRNE